MKVCCNTDTPCAKHCCAQHQEVPESAVERARREIRERERRQNQEVFGAFIETLPARPRNEAYAADHFPIKGTMDEEVPE